ncbi:MAG: alpha/beta fold hydrolase [Erythrobacter sp.]
MKFGRRISAAVAAAVVLLPSIAPAEETPPPQEDAALLAYADTSRSVTLSDGRRIHLTCMGEGAPTVILAAGAGNWGASWKKVQPEIAKRTRVCAWDRAGYGLSDASPVRQTILATTADLAEALDRSGLPGSFVMVGHSLAGLELLLLADRMPQRIAGMVLVDPSIPGQAAKIAAVAPQTARFMEAFQAQILAYVRGCADALSSGKLTPGGADPDGCLAYPPEVPAALRDALVRADMQPGRFATAASFTDAMHEEMALAVNPRRDLGAMPLIVLTAAEPPDFPPDTPQAVTDEVQAVTVVFRAGHEEIARLSTRGVQRVVPGTSHNIQQIRPEAVVSAVSELVDTVRAEARAD